MWLTFMPADFSMKAEFYVKFRICLLFSASTSWSKIHSNSWVVPLFRIPNIVWVNSLIDVLAPSHKNEDSAVQLGHTYFKLVNCCCL